MEHLKVYSHKEIRLIRAVNAFENAFLRFNLPSQYFHPKKEYNTMIRRIWTIARLDLLIWIRTPIALVCAIIPPLGMALLLLVLTLSVGQQPVALVVRLTDHLHNI